MDARTWITTAAALLAAPLLPGIINRTKAFFAGRKGAPLLQPYFDLARLLGKGAVYSRTTTWVFRAGPMVALAAVLSALVLLPQAGLASPAAFPGDLVLLLYLLGVARFATILAALDTGSSFEGMGASREAWFSALAEPALFLGLAALAHLTGQWSLSPLLASLGAPAWMTAMPVLLLVAAAVLVVLLAENGRIPVDDPDTHLELTMIHEVMALDHGGPDFALITYGAALKLWIFSSLLVAVLLPLPGGPWWQQATLFYGGMILVSLLVGVIESIMARLRLRRVPHILFAAGAFSVFALLLVLREVKP